MRRLLAGVARFMAFSLVVTIILGSILWSFWSSDMAKNVLAEIFGIIVTLIFIDAIYHYRQKKTDQSRSHIFWDRLKRLSSDTQISVGTFSSGINNVSKLQSPKHVANCLDVIRVSREFISEVEKLTDVFGFMTNQQFIIDLGKKIKEIENCSDTLELIGFSQTTLSNELSEYKEYFIPPGRPSFSRFIEAAEVALAKSPDETKLSESLSRLKSLFQELDCLINSFSETRISFWQTVWETIIRKG